MAKCRHCGQEHVFRCPQVKEIEFYEDGTEKRVVYMTPVDYAVYPNYIPVYTYPYHRPTIPTPIPYYYNDVPTCIPAMVW